MYYISRSESGKKLLKNFENTKYINFNFSYNKKNEKMSLLVYVPISFRLIDLSISHIVIGEIDRSTVCYQSSWKNVNDHIDRYYWILP